MGIFGASHRVRRTSIVSALAVAGVLGGLAAPAGAASTLLIDLKVPQIAHRGFVDSKTGENTHAAIRHAIQKGYAGIEFDVRLTADNRAVLLHDSTLNRTSNCSGLISEWKFEKVTTKCKQLNGSVASYAATTRYVQKLSKQYDWDGTIFVHVKVPLTASTAKGLVSGARSLNDEEQRVVFMVETVAQRNALVAAGWDGKDEGKTHKNGAWKSGKLYGNGDVERIGKMVHSAADWTLPGFQVHLPYQANPDMPGYDANITKKRTSIPGIQTICLPGAPTPLSKLPLNLDLGGLNGCRALVV